MRRRLAVAGIVAAATLIVGAGLATSAAFGGPGFRLGRAAFEIHKVDEAHFSSTGDQPVFVLVIGSDAREGLDGARGDALHLIGVNPAAGQATILNIPRDTYTHVPGSGMDKINAGLQVGGPATQAQAVSELVGVDIPYVVTTAFDGFMDMVDALGGVEVDVPVAMADANSGAYFDAGRQNLLGGPALALARNRDLDGGDFTRTQNQALLIVAGLAKLRAEGPSLTNTVKWLALLLRHSSFDGAGLRDVYRLGQLALSIDPANVRSVTMPGVTATLGAAGSVVLVADGAASLFQDFRDDGILQSH